MEGGIVRDHDESHSSCTNRVVGTSEHRCRELFIVDEHEFNFIHSPHILLQQIHSHSLNLIAPCRGENTTFEGGENEE